MGPNGSPCHPVQVSLAASVIRALLSLALLPIVVGCTGGATGSLPRVPVPTVVALQSTRTSTTLSLPPTATPRPQNYTVQPGDTLVAIAARFGVSVEALAQANGIDNPNLIQPGQRLRIPALPTVAVADSDLAAPMLPDSEFVYGPSLVGFDVAAFVSSQPGFLRDYAETVEGVRRPGAEIVELVAQRFSVGPRLLLALLELKSGWVTGTSNESATAEGNAYAMGHRDPSRASLYLQLGWAADQLNAAYYGWKYRDRTQVVFAGGNRLALDPGLNAGTAGLLIFLGLESDEVEWRRMVGDGPESFHQVYQRLFGDPFQSAIVGAQGAASLPPDLKQPELRLPWEAGQTWYWSGGPHGAWGDGSAWAALDFVPGTGRGGCWDSNDWIVAAAPGLVVRSGQGEVLVDLDGDGWPQTGWVLLYFHVKTQDRVPVGTRLNRGDRIGHPSCEGGVSDATHLHFARKYNGEWIPAGGPPAPMVLSGWTVQPANREYFGSMVKGGIVKTDCECWDEERNGLISDNSP
jgi:LasA protease